MLFKLNTNARQVVPYIQRSILILFVGFSVSAQTIEDISFGTEDTFEIVTWNIEKFPKNKERTIAYVQRIIKAIDADVYAIQEVASINDFNQLVHALKGYEGYLESTYFAGLAYIYNKERVQINEIYEIYTTSEYWKAFPRSPMVMDLTFKGARMIVINNHFKCCGDGILDATNHDDQEAKRYKASVLLKQYIDTHFSDLNVLLVGDLNDRLTDAAANNVFTPYFEDSENYRFVDYEIAAGNSTSWSFPTWPSHLDHILITNELFDEYSNEDTVIEVLKVEEYITGGWNAYENEITDHRPVAFKFKVNNPLNTSDVIFQTAHFVSYPNPLSTQTTFLFYTLPENGKIEIFNIWGVKVFSKGLVAGQNTLIWDANKWPSGLYIAKLLRNNKKIATLKLIIQK